MTEQSHISEGHNASWLPTGLVLEGRWRIEGKLGRGGFATVYHGAHVQLERKAAIKVLDIQAPPEELAIFEERFLREAPRWPDLDRIGHPDHRIVAATVRERAEWA